jgi:deoxycytidylate deaminase
VITRKNQIVAKGYNTLRTHPKAPSPYKTRHAEVDAVLKLKGKEGDTLYICRIKKNGELSCSFPCPHCMSFLKKFGIKKVVYSNWDGNFMEVEI